VAPGSQKLAIKARETTWVAIRIDQQERRQVLLQPGETVTYTGNLFQIDVGNAGGIDVSLQGKPLPPLGESGQVVHLTLP
jgi:cytoskeleton protein RodZ